MSHRRDRGSDTPVGGHSLPPGTPVAEGPAPAGSPGGAGPRAPGRAGRIVGRWVDGVRRHAAPVVLLTVFATGASLLFAVRGLGIDTDTEDLLSPELEWRQQSLEYKRAFPHLFDNITVVVHGQTPDLAHRARSRLAGLLGRPGEPFEEVFLPDGGPWLERHALLYRSPERLESLSENLRRFGPWLRRLERDPALTNYLGLLDSTLRARPLGEAIGTGGARSRVEEPGDAAGGTSEIDLGPVLGFTGEAFAAGAARRFYSVSWQQIVRGERATEADHRRFLLVRPVQDYSRLRPAGTSIRRIRELAAQANLTPESGITVRLTGQVVMEDEELGSVRESAGLAGSLALVAVTLVLWWGLRSRRLIGSSLATLLAGLSGTAAFATLAVGHLNLISVAFAVLYIGLGVDYAIHFCLRYRELLAGGSLPDAALRRTGETVGPSLLLSAVTTAVSFYVFVPTDFAGVSELGLISGTGMFVSVFSTLTVLPALLSLRPLSPERAAALTGRNRPQWWVRLTRLPSDRPRPLLLAALVAGGLALLSLPGAHFDHNPVNLRDPDTESVQTYRALVRDSAASPLTIAVLVEDAEAAARTARKLERLSTVRSARTIADFVPTRQTARLTRIAGIASTLGPPPRRLRPAARRPADGTPTPTPDTAPEPDTAAGVATTGDSVLVARRRAALEELRDGLLIFRPAAEGQLRARADFLSLQMLRWRGTVELFDTEGERRFGDELERSLLGTLPGQISLLRRSTRAGRVTLDSLPSARVARWVTPDGRQRVEVVPDENVAETPALRRFVESVRAAVPAATGPPVVQLLAGRVAVDAFRTALLWALVATAVVLYLSLGSVRHAVLVVVPLLLAGVLTGAFSAMADVPFNFANIIALPLLLGVGVDNGIHMVHRSREAPPADGNLLGTSTARAVLVSFTTTILSFGNLAFSSHRGMATMGQLLTVGMLTALVCTLFVLPALLRISERRSDRPPAARAGRKVEAGG